MPVAPFTAEHDEQPTTPARASAPSSLPCLLPALPLPVLPPPGAPQKPKKPRSPSTQKDTVSKLQVCDIATVFSLVGLAQPVVELASTRAWGTQGEMVKRTEEEYAEDVKAAAVAATKYEDAALLASIGELSSRLNLSQDDLLALYEQTAPPDVQVDVAFPDSSLASTGAANEEKRGLATVEEEQDEEPEHVEVEAEVKPVLPTRRSARQATSERKSYAQLSSDGHTKGPSSTAPPFASLDTIPEFSTPPRRKHPSSPPPLPPIDMTGRARLPVPYHFPLSEAAKANFHTPASAAGESLSPTRAVYYSPPVRVQVPDETRMYFSGTPADVAA
ncbi:hypothetical protein JCM10213_002205 [Rhodosporidiobolus nylandii]